MMFVTSLSLVEHNSYLYCNKNTLWLKNVVTNLLTTWNETLLCLSTTFRNILYFNVLKFQSVRNIDYLIKLVSGIEKTTSGSFFLMFDFWNSKIEIEKNSKCFESIVAFTRTILRFLRHN